MLQDSSIASTGINRL